MVNLAMVGRQLQYRNKINQNNVNLLHDIIYLENTEIVSIAIF